MFLVLPLRKNTVDKIYFVIHSWPLFYGKKRLGNDWFCALGYLNYNVRNLFVSNFDDLITEQIPRLRRYSRALINDISGADDLVQDTLERAWSRSHLWQRGSNLRAWLFTMMHNVFVNRYHSEKSKGNIVEFDESMDIPVQDGAESSMQVRDLQKALQLLPTEFREVVLLVGLEQLTYEEVAEILNIPLGTVMSRLSRGRERLHVLMSGQTPVLRRVK